MNTAKHLLSCGTCGDDFELPENCGSCASRPSKTDTPVCPPFNSGVISTRVGHMPPPASIPAEILSHRELLSFQKRSFRRVARRLEDLQDSMVSKTARGSFLRGLAVGVGAVLIVVRLVSCLD